MAFPPLGWLPCAFALPLLVLTSACADSSDDGGAAHIGVVTQIDSMPDVTIDDENGTEVRVFVDMRHMGGPTAATFEVVSASLGLDLDHYADIDLAIPMDHPQWDSLADGEEFAFELRGSVPDNHSDWGLCLDPQAEAADGQRVTVNLVLRVTPGANDDADEFEFESLAVSLHCSYTA